MVKLWVGKTSYKIEIRGKTKSKAFGIISDDEPKILDEIRDMHVPTGKRTYSVFVRRLRPTVNNMKKSSSVTFHTDKRMSEIFSYLKLNTKGYKVSDKDRKFFIRICSINTAKWDSKAQMVIADSKDSKEVLDDILNRLEKVVSNSGDNIVFVNSRYKNTHIFAVRYKNSMIARRIKMEGYTCEDIFQKFMEAPDIR